MDSEPDLPVEAHRLGESVCVLRAGSAVREATTAELDAAATQATVDGCDSFVFDLTLVGRYETPALRALADLWRRLDGFDCSVHVAARNPGVVECLHRVVAARGRWALKPTVNDALAAVLAAPV